MNDVPPSRPVAHHLQRSRTSAAVFQSPSRAEAVAVGHQPLHGDPRQLRQPVQVLERVGERPEAAVRRGTRAGPPRSAPRRAATRAARRPRRSSGASVVRVLVLVRRSASTSASGTAAHGLDELTDAVAVDRDAEPDLRLDLVALGDRDLAHVVAEARDPRAAAPRASRTRRAPRCRSARDDRGIAPVPDDRLARAAPSASP